MATAGSRREAGGRTGLVLGGLVVLGAISFVVAVAGGSGTHAWAVFLANLLFWSGLSAAGPAIAGIFELTDARWAARLRRTRPEAAPDRPGTAALAQLGGELSWTLPSSTRLESSRPATAIRLNTGVKLSPPPLASTETLVLPLAS